MNGMPYIYCENKTLNFKKVMVTDSKSRALVLIYLFSLGLDSKNMVSCVIQACCFSQFPERLGAFILGRPEVSKKVF
jgi:hypothetical protein